MRWKKYLPYIASILIALAIGAIGALVTSQGMPVYQQLVKPPLTPPPIVFPVVWTILYVLMGISAAMIWKSSSDFRGPALTVYTAQLLFNGLWSILFFGLHTYFFSFLWLVILWLLVAATAVLFHRIKPISGYLQIPYLLWITFAGYLNLGIWQLNR